MPQTLNDALTYSQRWLEIIHSPTVKEVEGKQIIEESKQNFAEHFNKGWLEYRKSVTEAGDWAATEWTGEGAIFYDVLGRAYIDCLGLRVGTVVCFYLPSSNVPQCQARS